jgi:hypothetical protein
MKQAEYPGNEDDSPFVSRGLARSILFYFGLMSNLSQALSQAQ